jgi:hypothetical protein
MFFGDLSTTKAQDFPSQKLCDLAIAHRYVNIEAFPPQVHNQLFQLLFWKLHFQDAN